MAKSTFVGISASGTQKWFISEEKSTEIFQFATGEIPLRVLYQKKGLCQGWLCRETDFLVMNGFSRYINLRKLFSVLTELGSIFTKWSKLA